MAGPFPSVRCILIPAPRRPAEASGAGQTREFRDLRAMSMTKNERRRAARAFLQFTGSCLQSFGWVFREERASRRLQAMCNAIGDPLLLHQDRRNLRSRARFFLTGGIPTSKKVRRELTRRWRFSHGIARAIEGLRRVRKSLVSRPDPREYLLPCL